MYAKMWQEDVDAKCKREEMEEAQKIERNRQMLKVCIETDNHFIFNFNLLALLIGTHTPNSCNRETERGASFPQGTGGSAFGRF